MSPATLVEELAALDAAAVGFANANRAASTESAYQADFDHFTRWCEAHQAIALPAEAATVARYLTDIHSGYR